MTGMLWAFVAALHAAALWLVVKGQPAPPWVRDWSLLMILAYLAMLLLRLDALAVSTPCP